MICIWKTNASRDHSVSADSVTVSLVITTMSTTRITSMSRWRPTHWVTRGQMGSCRTTEIREARTTPTTADCSSSTRLETAATATSANVNMGLASKTPRWSLWYMSPLESKTDGANGQMAEKNLCRSLSHFQWNVLVLVGNVWWGMSSAKVVLFGKVVKALEKFN